MTLRTSFLPLWLLALLLLVLTPMAAHAQTEPYFPGQVTNPFGLSDFGDSPSVADLDGDGDQDVLSVTFGGKFYFFENTAGAGNTPSFASPIANPFSLSDIGQRNSKPSVADLDGDGDFDVLVGREDGDFYYFRNTAGAGNTPSFAAFVTNPFGLTGISGLGHNRPSVADLDGDGDQDVLSGNFDGGFLFFENTAGAGNTPSFAVPVSNPFGLVGVGNANAPSVADLDGDGDQDVLSGRQAGGFRFFENTAGAGNTPNFAVPVADPFGLHIDGFSVPSVADLDGDGDQDVLAGVGTGSFRYYENFPWFIINTTSDAGDVTGNDGVCATSSGACSLRAALQQAEFSAGANTISFDIPASDPGCTGGTCTIAVTSNLPTITDPIILDGSTQPGSEGVCTSAIPDRPAYGIALDGSGAGTVSGLTVGGGGSGSVIRGLNIHSFEQHGIDLNGSTNNHIACNFIGTNADGSAAFPNLIHGLRLTNGAAQNFIGTDGDGMDDAFEGNLISGNGDSGLHLAGGNANIVAGNFIGTDRAGTQALGNAANGIVLDNGVDFNRIGTNGNGTSDAEERNLISGNTEHGVLIQDDGTSGNAVAGNYIGADIGGAALGNGGDGVYINLASGNRIGFAGTGPGSNGAQANLIRDNGGDGVQVFGILAVDNRVRGNRTFSNGLLGINLGNDGVTPNDAGDPDVGPNRMQNTPVVVSAVLNPQGDLIITYLVDTHPEVATYPLHIDVYLADSDGEGQTWLGGISYESADARSLVTATLSPAVAVTDGDVLVATATDADGNTSEFSAAIAVVPLLFSVNATDDDGDDTAGDGLCDTGQTNSAGAAECTLRAAIEEANAFAGADSIRFDIPTSDSGCTGGTCVIQPTSVLPDITSVVVIDGSTQPGSEGVCTSAIPDRPAYGIALDGSGAGFAHGLRFDAGSDGSVLRGLNVRHYERVGILFIGSTNGRVQCSFVGTNETGTATASNGENGILAASGANALLVGSDGDGTDDAYEGNLLSGNGRHGVGIAAAGGVVAGNYIGANRSGTAGLPNGLSGVLVNQVSNVRVGTDSDGVSDALEGNLIRSNTENGVVILGETATGNRMRGNQIFANTLLGIDLGGDGVTPNDNDDVDLGPNRRQNFPNLSEVSLDGGDVTVTYSVNADPIPVPGQGQATYPLKVEFFLADADGEEGQMPLGSDTYTANDHFFGPSVTSTFTPAVAVAQGDLLVATATDADGNTSEFSAAVEVVTGPFVVDATSDDSDATPGDGLCATAAGACTLRSAIEEANAFAGADSIYFNIPAGDSGCANGTCVIQPASALPEITSVVILDGSTQPGSEAVCTSAIPDRPLYGIALDGTNAGSTHGLQLTNGSGGSVVRGLNIRSFQGKGLSAQANLGSRVQCSFIGTDETGTGIAANADHGIEASGTSSFVAGTDGDGVNDAAEGNLISGNGRRGLNLGTSSVVAGNFIGTDKSGTAALPNTLDGIANPGGSNVRVGTDSDGVSDELEGNLISGNGGNGILIAIISTGTVVAGNRIGTDITGTQPLGNGTHGVRFTGSGGNNPVGNRLGSDGNGVNDAAEGNVIAFNALNGIVVNGNSTRENAILGNAIFANGALGIDLGADLGADGVTDNDADDADETANRGQNYPDIATAILSGSDLEITYLVDTAPANATYPLRIEFFRADADGEEGQTWLGTFSYEEADAQAQVTDNITPAVAVSSGDLIVATATDADGNTSEFSASVAIIGTGAGLTVAASLWLEGPFNGTTMNTSLSGHLPQNDPYGLGESVASADFFTTDTGGQQVVDWVWLELRSDETTAVASTAALLLFDGSIKATDATSEVVFSGVDAGSYYLVIGHRNHLAVMSATAIDCSSGACSHDFRTAQSTAYTQGSDPLTDLSGSGTGPFALIAADGSGDGLIGSADQTLWLSGRGSSLGYHGGDHNLDGLIGSADQTLWLSNRGQGSQVPATDAVAAPAARQAAVPLLAPAPRRTLDKSSH